MNSSSVMRMTTSTVQDRGIANAASPSDQVRDTATSVLVRSQEIIEASARVHHIGGSGFAVGTSTGDVAPVTDHERTVSPTGARSARRPVDILEFPKFEAIRPRPQAFLVLAEWEGVVVQADQDKITAQLVPVSGGESVAQTEAEIPWDEVAESDHELVRSGAHFRLAVGYETSGGTRTHFSRVVFRRLPAWNRRALEEADAVADAYFHGIRVE